VNKIIIRNYKLLFLITEDWYFWSHRLPIAQAAKSRGYDVVVATKVNEHRGLIEQEGFRLIPISMRRKSHNIFYEMSSIIELISIYRKEKPNIVHHVAMKPVLYGTIAARLTGVPFVVNALAGLGHIFTASNLKTSLIRFFVKSMLRFVFNCSRSTVILQNHDDMEKLNKECNLRKEMLALIRGSGVDLQRYYPLCKPKRNIPVVLLPSRMLWEKGVREFMEAAKILKNEGVSAKFVLIGRVDPDSPSAISTGQLRQWNTDGIVEWWGYSDDIPSVFAQTDIVCLPTFYGEGIPKVLIEAAACGCPIVATDIPGCREVVKNGINGFLVPIKNAEKLAEALRKLIQNNDLRMAMGAKGREIAVNEFSVESVVKQTLGVYSDLIMQ
jgi:glycosyltransferase involved in cell wall biosynthesis